MTLFLWIMGMPLFYWYSMIEMDKAYMRRRRAAKIGRPDITAGEKLVLMVFCLIWFVMVFVFIGIRIKEWLRA